MRGMRVKRGMLLVAVTGIVTIFSHVSVLAITSTSNNYQMTESKFGVTGNDQSCSGSYCTRTSVGDMTDGTSSSQNYQAQQGSSQVTDAEPTLNVEVMPGQTNLGTFTPERTATKIAKVHVLSYRSNGYQVQIMGGAPTYSGYTLATPSVPTASMPGVEQFGINVVANSSPSLGANPIRVGANTETVIGYAAPGYNTANLFKYKDGDTVAESKSSSGETEFTISMIVNVATSTPAGQYESDLSVVVIPVF